MRHIRNTISAILALMPTLLGAQIIQQVQVVEYQGENTKTPLDNVVLSVYNAPTAVSDTEGQAVLQFRVLHEGDKVRLRRMERDGYEVFNQEAVDQWTASSSKPFRLVVCRSERLRQLREQYMQQASASYQIQYKRDQEQLLKLRQHAQLQEAEYQQQLSELEAQHNQQLDKLDTYVDQFARIDLESLNQEQRNIISLVQQGQFDQAIAAYEACHFLDRYQQESQDIARIDGALTTLQSTLNQKRQSQQSLLDAIDRQITLYALAGGRDNFRKIYDLRKGTVDADTTNIGILREFIVYAFTQSRFDEGLTYAQMLLRQTDNLPEHQIWCYSFLGNMYDVSYDYEKAEAYYAKGQEIARQYQGKEDTPWEVKVSCAVLQSSYAILEMMFGRYESAYPLLVAAEPVMAERYEFDPSPDWLNGISQVRIHKAYCMAMVDSLYTEAYALLDQTRDVLQPYIFKESYIAMVYMSLESHYAMLAESQGNTPLVLKTNRNLYEFVKQSYQNNPDMFADCYLGSIENLAGTYFDIQESSEIEELLSPCEGLIEYLEKQTSTVQDIHRFKYYFFKGWLQKVQGKPDEFQKYLKLATEIYERLTADPDNIAKEALAGYMEVFEELKK